MDIKTLMAACPNLEVVLVGDKPAITETPIDVIAKASAYAQAGGNFDLSRKLNETLAEVERLASVSAWALAVLESLRKPGVLAKGASIADHYPDAPMPAYGLMSLRNAAAKFVGAAPPSPEDAGEGGAPGK